MRHQNLQIEVPVEYEEYAIEKAAISTKDRNVGFLIMSKGMNRLSKDISVLVFLTKLEMKSYHPLTEIGSFNFQIYEQAREFVDYLPNMTAIDLLLLQSGPVITV